MVNVVFLTNSASPNACSYDSPKCSFPKSMKLAAAVRQRPAAGPGYPLLHWKMHGLDGRAPHGIYCGYWQRKPLPLPSGDMVMFFVDW